MIEMLIEAGFLYILFVFVPVVTLSGLGVIFWLFITKRKKSTGD